MFHSTNYFELREKSSFFKSENFLQAVPHSAGRHCDKFLTRIC